MSLTTGKGPLSGDPAGRFTAPVPDGVAYVEPFRRRIRGIVGGRTVVDSERAVLVHRPRRSPACVFPEADVVGVDGVAVPEAPGYVEVAWAAVDEWYEEDERMLGHPRNPYHRVDCLRTTRHLRVDVAGETLVDTTDTLAVFETSLDPRLYVAREHVRMDLLVPSTTTTYCPYKGTATYWSARVGDVTVEDVAWCYDAPFPECRPLGGMLSFYAERADVVQALPA